MTDNLEELERLLDRTGKCLDHPKLQVSDRDAKALRDRLIATAREVEELRAEVARLQRAGRHLMPYLTWTIGAESPGHHPTMPSAVDAFRAALEGKGG